MRKMTMLLASLALVAFAGAATAQVDVELAFDPTEAAPGDEVAFFASIANLGDEAADADVEIMVTYGEYEFGPLSGTLPLAAGEEISKEIVFLVPFVPEGGDLVITATATIGEYSDTATAILTIVLDGEGYWDGGMDALPQTILDEITGDEDFTAMSFSRIKALF